MCLVNDVKKIYKYSIENNLQWTITKFSLQIISWMNICRKNILLVIYWLNYTEYDWFNSFIMRQTLSKQNVSRAGQPSRTFLLNFSFTKHTIRVKSYNKSKIFMVLLSCWQYQTNKYSTENNLQWTVTKISLRIDTNNQTLT